VGPIPAAVPPRCQTRTRRPRGLLCIRPARTAAAGNAVGHRGGRRRVTGIGGDGATVICDQRDGHERVMAVNVTYWTLAGGPGSVHLAAALFGLQIERPGQLAQALVALAFRERGRQLDEPVPGGALGQDLQQPLPAGLGGQR